MNASRLAGVAWVTLAAASVFAVYAFVVPEFKAAQGHLSRAHAAYDQTVSNQAEIRDAASIEARRSQVAAQLASMSVPTDVDRGLGASLRDIASVERRFGIVVTRLVPDDRPEERATQRFTVQMQGSYDDVLRSVAALTRGPALMRVAGLRVQRSASMAGWVDAEVHVILYDGIGRL